MLLRLTRIAVIPHLQVGHESQDRHRAFLLHDPSIGSPMPPCLKGISLPAVVIVHSQCLSSSIKQPESVVRCFRRPEIVNVVVAASQAEYREIAVDTSNSNAIYLGQESNRFFNPVFGPRMYGYNKKGLLVYIQQEPDTSLPELLDECKDKINK